MIAFFIALLSVLFIGLKLGNVIDWSWPWVLSPIWGYACIWLAAVITLVISEWQEIREHRKAMARIRARSGRR